MMPALQLISDFASNNTQLISANSLYWMTGSLSGVLDNAPTYLNFMAAGMGKVGLDIGSKQDVLEFVAGSFSMLLAISVSSVFFGAFTYIGNAPNFMVKSIAEQAGIKMPSFAGYVVRYSIPILLPMLFLSWLLLKFGFF
jgi:Na+/H+ antiporter NhaD/arsenite permease-like protein